MLRLRNRIIEYPQANPFDRSICFLVWATLASFWKPSRSIYIRQTINFNKINVSNRHVYYPVNTCVRIALTSSLINGFSGTNCRHRCIQRRWRNPFTTALQWLYLALLSPIYSRPYNRPYERLYIVSTNGSALSLRTALHHLYERLCNGSTTALQRLCNGSTMALQRPYNGSTDGSINGSTNSFTMSLWKALWTTLHSSTTAL